MGISSIEVHNLLSFEHIYITNIEDINCIVGRNNVGKSNLLKLLKYFYSKLDEQRELPPELNNKKYSSNGYITITFDVSRILNIIYSKNVNNSLKGKYKYLKYLFKLLMSNNLINKNKSIKLTLKINSDDSIKWNIDNRELHKQLYRLFPFFYIDTRHINLYDWSDIWDLASRLKSFNTKTIEQNDIKSFFDEKLSSSNSREYGKYIENIETLIDTHTSSISNYSYRDKVLNYIKVGIKGHNFLFKGENIDIQSDGTNSSNFIQIYLAFIIALTRRDYITPLVYIDEPEIGLHPKKNEELIYNLYEQYISLKKLDNLKKLGKYRTPYPSIFFSTHSPNIVKYIIKLFNLNQQILHFSKDENNKTLVSKLNSQFADSRYLNVFSDNEARLYFSDFILFVEGETELEIFGNKKLNEKFIHLKYIDVYKTSSNVILKYANPSYANTSIPYKILYDIDKILKFKSNTFILYNDNVRFDLIHDKYKKVFFSHKKDSPYQKYKKFRTDVISKMEKPYSVSNNIYIEDIDYKLLVKDINTFLYDEGYIFVKTTIEETLISEKSIMLFLKWLLFEFDNNEAVGITSHEVDNVKKIYETGKLDITFKKIFCTKGIEYNINNLNKEEKKFVFKIKDRYRRLMTIKLNRMFTEKEFHTAILIIFNGKTNTLVSNNTLNSSGIDNKFQQKIKNAESLLLGIPSVFKKKPKNKSIVNKTSGWTTKFLNFAIDELDKNVAIEMQKNGLLKKDVYDKKEETVLFKNKFIELFEELYVIINQTKL